ncbi:B12-binding domain-containing radical SAM protein [Sphingomonas sp. 37zxx]|uniref:B12-binding domain-containing radical SAM protein n=1 Tax=Sphingomonas sp. 37zxx TaxID=1550073 RepID=UPI00068BC0FB|nr:radical SAM protein [Sphingomonas sp. 37zxx]
MKKKILLVSPGTELESIDWIDRYAKNIKHQPAYVAPLSIATVAGLTPDRYDVQLWDEAVQGPAERNLDAGYDLVGITGYSDHLSRGLIVADAFRARGIPVVLGGAGITAAPHKGKDHADAIIVGEAEATWPRFLDDFDAGRVLSIYRAPLTAEIGDAPPPRWDSIAAIMPDSYKSGSVETSRGCPFDCEFCDVWKKFGRKMRTKPVPQVLDEIRTLERIGMKRIYLATDNFIGAPKYAKEVLRALAPMNRQFRYPMSFMAELTLTLAQDTEMMALLAQANFTRVLIGLESTNEDSLKETRKRQNLRGDMIAKCRTIASYGIGITGSLIVGFDNDGIGVFDDQAKFIQEALIPIPRLNILRALDGTDLYDRLGADGRLIDMDKTYSREELRSLTLPTNLLFNKMRRSELYEGFLALQEQVWNWRNFEPRTIGFIDNFTNLPDRGADDRLDRVVPQLQATMRQLPEADAGAIDRILSHVRAKAPAYVWEIAAETMIQAYHAAQMPNMRKMLTRQVAIERRLEANGGYVPLEIEPVVAESIAVPVLA